MIVFTANAETSFRSKWVGTHFFCCLFLKELSGDRSTVFSTHKQLGCIGFSMTHPLTPQILELAEPVAESIGLEVVGAVFHTNQSPPVLRLDIRNPSQHTSLEDCERMSRAFEASLDAVDLIPTSYVLEVSSPGISRVLTTDREFISFKGFAITVNLSEPLDGHKTIAGRLVKRDEDHLYVNQKGRAIAIPRTMIQRVQLDERHAGG
jgi:ribosome maturation factor RimP